MRGELVPRAESWRWSSVWRFYQGAANSRRLLTPWPIPRPRDWRTRVNSRRPGRNWKPFVARCGGGQPFGSEGWCEKIVRQLGLESSVRSPGRTEEGHRIVIRPAENDTRPLSGGDFAAWSTSGSPRRGDHGLARARIGRP